MHLNKNKNFGENTSKLQLCNIRVSKNRCLWFSMLSNKGMKKKNNVGDRLQNFIYSIKEISSSKIDFESKNVHLILGLCIYMYMSAV